MESLRVVKPATRSAAQATPQDLAAWMEAVALRADRQAFAALFGHFAPRIKAFLMRSGTPDGVAEDVAQEALLTLWRKAALFDVRQASVATWVFTIARNLRIDHLRRSQALAQPSSDDNHVFDPDYLPSDAVPLDELLHAERLALRLRTALVRLPPEQAQVLHLAYYDDAPHALIAQQLRIPLGTVKSRLRLAIAQLRRLLDDTASGPTSP